MTTSKIPPRIVGVYVVVYSLAALVGGVYLAFQGNGNRIWSGFVIGAVAAFGCVALLLFGVFRLLRYLRGH